MSAEREVADLYVFILRKYASEDTAHTVAMALGRELMPGADDYTVRQSVSRAIATARVKAREAASPEHSGQHAGRDRSPRR